MEYNTFMMPFFYFFYLTDPVPIHFQYLFIYNFFFIPVVLYGNHMGLE